MTRLHERDVVLALKLVVSEPYRPSQRELAVALHESVGEVNASLARLRACHFFGTDDTIDRAELHRFLVHGLPHVFPAEIGPEAMGLTTGPNTPGILERYGVHQSTTWVWPTDYVITPCVGRGVPPLYPGAVRAAADDPQLHRLLALVDILRMGDRERWWRPAADDLARRLSPVRIEAVAR